MTVRFAVIGTGFAERVQLPGIARHREAETTVICSRTAENARQAAARFDVPEWTTDYREAVEGPVDAVIITTPPALHREMTLAAAGAGRHVLCEKPMALNAGEAVEMLQAAEQAGIVHMIDHEFRYLPVRARLTELVDDGFVGEPLLVHLTQFSASRGHGLDRPWSWWSDADMGGGVLGALGSHHIDALRQWCGPVEAITGGTEVFVPERSLPGEEKGTRAVTADDTYACQARFASGAVASLVCTTAVQHSHPFEVTVHGTRGTLRDVGDERLLGGRRGEEMRELPVPERLRSLPGGRHERDIDVDHFLEPPFMRLLDRFIAAVKGESVEAPTFVDGLAVQGALDGVRQAGDRGWVSVDERPGI